MLLTGEYDYTIDAKGRMAIPPDVRALMLAGTTDQQNGPANPQAFMLIIGPHRTLCLYPERVFRKLVEHIEDSLVNDETVDEFNHVVFPAATRLDIDSAGRVKLPEKHRIRAGMKEVKKITLIGVRDHFEIRDREQWASEMDERLDQQAEIFQRFARRRRNGAEGER